jgi:hypothetical protein
MRPDVMFYQIFMGSFTAVTIAFFTVNGVEHAKDFLQIRRENKGISQP